MADYDQASLAKSGPYSPATRVAVHESASEVAAVRQTVVAYAVEVEAPSLGEEARDFAAFVAEAVHHVRHHVE